MVTEFVERGTAGKCVTSRIMGGRFVTATELTAPGVPLSAKLEAQFCPLPFGNPT